MLARKVPALLDLACGRGGDIFKWIDADVQSVLGVDISKHEIEECQRRFVQRCLHLTRPRTHALPLSRTYAITHTCTRNLSVPTLLVLLHVACQP